MRKHKSMVGNLKLKSYINAQIRKEYNEEIDALLDVRYKEQISKLIEEQYEDKILKIIDMQITDKINKNDYIEELITQKIDNKYNAIENNWNTFKTTTQLQITRILSKFINIYKNRHKKTSKIKNFYKTDT